MYNKQFMKSILLIISIILITSCSKNNAMKTLSTETVTFTNASSTGREGPTQAQINSAYSGTNLANKVTINTQGVQEWTVPATTVYTIDAYGAQGGNADGFGGKGARMKGDFSLNKDDVIYILVGQKGLDSYNANQMYGGKSSNDGGGGGTGGGSGNSPKAKAKRKARKEKIKLIFKKNQAIKKIKEGKPLSVEEKKILGINKFLD